MKLLDSVNEKIDKQKDEMIETLRQLVAIPSVEAEAEGDMPFGENVQKAYMYMMEKAADEGMETFNADNYGGHIEYGGIIKDDTGQIVGTSDEILGIVGHLDVVPAGDGWDCDPFEGEIKDGKIYGRGAIDDKGPVVSCFYALKALKDCGIVPEKKVRIILGLDEETNWSGMDRYLTETEAPDLGFTPDGEFPAIHGEKGIIVFDVAKKFSPVTAKGLELRTLKGGNAANMVPDYARAVVRDEDAEIYEKIKEKAELYRNEKQYKINCKGVGKSLEITAQGASAHGARPETGINAISILMDFLGELNFINDDMNDFIEFYNGHIGFETNGKSLGCGLSDEPSGDLILNCGMINLDSKAADITINVRYPVTFDDEKVYEAIMPVLNKYDLGVVKGKHQLPIYIPEDDFLIKTLMDIYREHTGDKNSRPLVIGGGTYARAMKNVVAFGASFPGEHEVAHQKNEYIETEKFMAMTKIYADAIYRLSRTD